MSQYEEETNVNEEASINTNSNSPSKKPKNKVWEIVKTAISVVMVLFVISLYFDNINDKKDEEIFNAAKRCISDNFEMEQSLFGSYDDEDIIIDKIASIYFNDVNYDEAYNIIGTVIDKDYDANYVYTYAYSVDVAFSNDNTYANIISFNNIGSYLIDKSK